MPRKYVRVYEGYILFSSETIWKSATLATTTATSTTSTSILILLQQQKLLQITTTNVSTMSHEFENSSAKIMSHPMKTASQLRCCKFVSWKETESKFVGADMKISQSGAFYQRKLPARARQATDMLCFTVSQPYKGFHMSNMSIWYILHTIQATDM